MRPYPEYKESGVEWIGEIPKHWEVVRSKHLFGNRNQRGYEGEPLLSVTQDQGILPRNELDYRVWNPDGNIKLYKLVRPGDWVISLRTPSSWVGVELSEARGIVLCCVDHYVSSKADLAFICASIVLKSVDCL